MTLWNDRLDSTYAPAVFGMTPFQLEYIVQAVLHTTNINSVSIVEMNPQYDVDNRTNYA